MKLLASISLVLAFLAMISHAYPAKYVIPDTATNVAVNAVVTTATSPAAPTPSLIFNGSVPLKWNETEKWEGMDYPTTGVSKKNNIAAYGIVLGTIFGCILAVLGIMWFYHKKHKKEQCRPPSPDNGPYR